MSDLIRKEDALMCARPEYLNPNQEKLASYNQGWNNAIEMYYRQIADLPTVEPKTGHWYIDAESDVRCTACKTKCLRDDIGINILSNYCPNCGAKMERRNDG